MDTLSRLLTLARTCVRLDVRCLLAGPFVLTNDIAPPGEAVFHLLLSGACQLQVQGSGEVLRLQAGDFVLLPQGEAHDIKDAQASATAPGGGAPQWLATPPGAVPVQCNTLTPGDDALDLLCGRFSYSAGAGQLLVQALPALLHVTLRDVAQLHGLVALLRDEAAQQRPGGRAVADALGQALFALALRAWGANGSAPGSVLALAADVRLGPSVQAMLREPGAPWTIESLGELVGMSRATYARHFQHKAGMGVAELLKKIRIMHACELLRGSRRGLADIAAAVGYQSEAAFSKAFRQAVGDSPGKWRGQRA